MNRKLINLFSALILLGSGVFAALAPAAPAAGQVGNKEFLYYYLPEQVTNMTDINPTTGNIIVPMPWGVPMNDLAAQFTVSENATVWIGGVRQYSGITTNNFTAPVTYTVRAPDNSTKTWVVSAPVRQSTSAELLSFSLPGPAYVSTSINSTAASIYVAMNPFVAGNYTATFAASPDRTSVVVGAVNQVSGATSNNFTNPVTYRVTAQNGNTKDWTVTVGPRSSAAEITGFSLFGTRYERYLAGTGDSGVCYGEWKAQTFVPSTSHSVSLVRLKLAGRGSPQGDIILSIRATDAGGRPTGPDLATAILPTSNVASSYPSYDWYDFDLGAGCAVQAGTRYAFVLRAEASVNLMHGIWYQLNTAGTYASGVMFESQSHDGSSWTEDTGMDFVFEEWDRVTGTTIDRGSHTIAVAAPSTADLTNLVAVFTASPFASVRVGGTLQTSGVTPHNFTSPVTYRVTAQNGSSTDWTVIVTQGAPSAGADITQYGLLQTRFSSFSEGATEDHFQGSVWRAQTFTSTAAHTVNVVRMRLFKGAGSPAGDVELTIRATDTQGRPTGAELAFGAVRASSLPVAADWCEFGLAPGLPLQANAVYALVLRAPDAVEANPVWFAFSTNTTFAAGSLLESNSYGTSWLPISIAGVPYLSADAPFDEWSMAPGTINNAQGIVSVRLPADFSLASPLIASFTTSPNIQSITVGAVPQVSGRTSNSFATSVQYVVTSENASVRTWVVSATVAPRLVSISPASALNIGAASFTLAGTGFLSGSSVKIARAGQADVAAATVNVVSPTQISFTLSLASSIAAGTWDVVVTNPDGQVSTLPGGLTVTAAPPPPPPPPPSGGGGGGGGVPAYTQVALTQLTASSPLMVSPYSGFVPTAAQLATSDGNCTLNIPAGAMILTSAGTPLIAMSGAKVDAPPSAVAPEYVLLAYEFGPAGATFNPYITLSIKYGGVIPQNMSEGTLRLGVWNGSQWETVAGTLDIPTKTFTASLTHFSVIALLGRIVAPPTTTPPIATTTPPAPSTTTPPPTVTPSTVPSTTTPATVPPTLTATSATPTTPVATTPPPKSGGSFPWGWVLVAAGAVIAVCLLVFLFLRRKV
jgi:hypothetical protein